MENPIKDNRIVSSHTYAVRNLCFLSYCYPDAIRTGQMFNEEFEYLCRVACDLIKYQVKTCPDSEKWYFNNLVNNYKNTKQIIEWCCEHNPDFFKFLKAIKAV